MGQISVKEFVLRHWFLLLLAISLAVGFLGPSAIADLGDLPGLRPSLVAGVLFLMGLGLGAPAVLESIRYPAAGLLALGINIVGVPLLAALVAPLLPIDLGGGLIVAAAVPCTLASASVWTRKGGGNDAISMLVTVVTNLLCFLIAPLTLVLLLGRSVPLSFADQAAKLALLVVAPLVAAQVLRQLPAVAAWVSRSKMRISIAAQAGILLMVLFGAAETVRRMGEGGTTTSTLWIVAVGALVIGVHASALFGGWWASGGLGLPARDRMAVAIAGSQKTLMVGLQIAIDCGVSMLPMILYHVGQLLVDTLFVERWGTSELELVLGAEDRASEGDGDPHPEQQMQGHPAEP
ncbi:bile acid:sodium symporter family protein [Candidatus Laterigemmans baculatus]|uniref:bile acid:sodium symporter family protein n=1 Tax=Candidatus Laterigemmans baculatus TaxID=2770505 RepID=UPI0013DA6EEF|nr:bile acid:sodium symporter [Candidatus Laterigemmans baculatus]